MCPITFLLLSCIVPLWCVGGDGGYGEAEMVWGGGDGRGRRRWYGEEMMVWGEDDGSKGHILSSPDLELVKQQQLVSAPL